eukprot:NODE_3813_length_1159_cov_87.066602_g3626_i0.p1 GENE.NODE_3813_length_1159_cov_87.066602_g3626_i0~~NODE_3813_length_1159_cov_87.066602_g3626_i0.p1  ORF type:complete len:370 (+),score=71.49 NODE_3813_length_1159_cov_87.066602_g3626_i0:64-1110(+)
MSRPETQAPPEVYYSADEANKYMQNSRIQKIQVDMTKRAIELMNLPPNCQGLTLLDLGCGTGLSGDCLEEMGHTWVGLDISRDMLDVAASRGAGGDLLHHDMGLGVPFRGGCFDGAISISALQWLCNADRKEHIPQRRLKKFFMSLFQSLARGARAVFQFYPANKLQLDMIVRASERCGFTGGLVVDYPHSTRAKKYFLVLFAGPASAFQVPQARTGMEEERGSESEGDEDEEDEEDEEDGESCNGDDEDMNDEDDEDAGEFPDGWNPNENKEASSGSHKRQGGGLSNLKKRPVKLSERKKKGSKRKGKTLPLTTKEWIMWKKEQAKARGNKTATASKYTGRKRKTRF